MVGQKIVRVDSVLKIVDCEGTDLLGKAGISVIIMLAAGVVP